MVETEDRTHPPTFLQAYVAVETKYTYFTDPEQWDRMDRGCKCAGLDAED